MNLEQNEYFRSLYTSIDSLASQTDLPVDPVEDLVSSNCIPHPCYEIRLREEAYAYINDDVNTLSVSTSERYFSKDNVHLLEIVKPYLDSHSLDEIATIIKERIKHEFLQGLELHGAASFNYMDLYQNNGALSDSAFDDHFEHYVWPNWIYGTWGICVYGSHSGHNIARKTVAVERVRALTDNGSKTKFSANESILVRQACEEYNNIVPPFSPHDRHDSSRARLVDTALSILDAQDSQHQLVDG